MDLIRFSGLDGHQIALGAVEVNSLVSATVSGTAVTNIYLRNGSFVTAEGTLDEIIAVLELGNDSLNEKEHARLRRGAEARRKAQLDVEETIKQSGLFSDHYRYAVEQAAAFILSLFASEDNWRCGRFNVVRALGAWDGDHRRAFQVWVLDPWRP